jgi:hypothetical protein
LVATDFFSLDILPRRHPPRVGSGLHRGAKLSLGDSAGSESHLATRRRRHKAQPADPRSRPEVPRHFRQHLRLGRSPSDPDTSHGTQGELARGTMDRQLPTGVPGLDADRLGGPPTAGAQ